MTQILSSSIKLNENQTNIVINNLAKIRHLTRIEKIFEGKPDYSKERIAELEKMSDKQRDFIEKLRDKRAEEKKNSEKSEEKKVNLYKKDETTSVKKVVVEASSEEELIEKIKNVDWNKVSGVNVGARFDFSV